MSSRTNPRTSFSQTLRQISSLFPVRESAAEEARLYYRRACLAAVEERYDVALIFCGKALELETAHLPTRLLVAQIHDRGLNDWEAAVPAYRKVISLAGYDSDNPYCATAKAGLDALTHKIQDSKFKIQNSPESASQS
jgi:tetratricopeptide (TPR) repeat protein